MKERFEVLDIFRGIFSSFVVLFHLSAFSATPILNNQFILNSDLFVDFFFVLSGFVITYSYQLMSSGEQLGRFFKKRFFRLYPLHILVLLIFVAIELSKHFASGYVHVNKIDNVSNNLTTFFTNIFLVNSVKMPGVHDVSWNVASWSISAEMISYLVFGLTMIFINSNNLSKIKSLICIAVIVIAGIAMYLCTGELKLTYSFDYGFLRGIVGFFFGVVCYQTFATSKAWFLRFGDNFFTLMEIILLAITIGLVCCGETLKTYGIIYEVMFFVTILIFAFEKGWLSKMLKKPALLHNMGKYSYSIYMIHTLILSLFNIVFIRVLKLPPSSYAYLFIVNYIIIYYAASWTFNNIEMRFNLSSTSKEKEKSKKGWWLW